MEHYLDYKATIWFRIPIDSKEALDKVIEKVEQGILPSELYNDMSEELGKCECMLDSEEFISPTENDGQSTIEIYSGNDNGNQECIWDNSKESEMKRHQLYSLEWFQKLPYSVIDKMFNTNLSRYLRATTEAEEDNLQKELAAVEIIFQSKTKNEIKNLFKQAIKEE